VKAIEILLKYLGMARLRDIMTFTNGLTEVITGGFSI
jgi:hypothetical protein